MKSIIFSKKGFQQQDILTRLQMKRVKGGHESGLGGTCQGLYSNPVSGGPNVRLTDLSKAEAEKADVNWCCDSCCSATWADHSGC